MRIQGPTRAWILICFMTVVSRGSTAQHDTTQNGDSTAQQRAQNTIVPFGIQIPEHVLSTQDVACVSADDNIFQIMNEALKTCNGTDMRCTFYHFVNHDYEKIGTLNVNKELFDDLLKKFDNWLLTAENIDKINVQGKRKEGLSLDTDNIHVNDRYKYEGKDTNSSSASKTNDLDTNEGKANHIISEAIDNKVHSHHVKNQDETHHKNHHHRWKNGNHIKLNTDYNNEHRYFEVFLPKDKETGKPRTIYVEIDRDKNEFVLLDEDIDKKLNGVEPIKIELDELSEIADTAFSDLVKSSKHKGINHTHSNLDEENRVIMTGDSNTNSEVVYHEVPLGTDADELTQNILNPSVCIPDICNINTNQQLISDKTTGNVKKVINASKSLVVPNKYINQAQFYVESCIDNTTNMMPYNDFEIIKNINETVLHEPDIHEQEPFITIEFDHNNITEIDINNKGNSSLEFIEIPHETENNNCTENNELCIDLENISYDDNDFIQLVENNDTNNDIYVDDTHDFESSNTVHIKDVILQDETPDIYVIPKSAVATMMPDNGQGYTDLKNHPLIPSHSIPQYTTVPILEKDLAKAIETDSSLQSSFPVYASAGDSQYIPIHPIISCHKSPIDSELGHQITGSKIPQYISPKFPSSPVVCSEGPNTGSKYSFLNSLLPPNFGVNWPHSYSPIEEVSKPCASKSLSLGSISSPHDSILPLIEPSMEFSEFTPAKTTAVQDPREFHNAPSQTFDVQEPCSTTSPLNLAANTQNIDFPSTSRLPFRPYTPIEATNSPYSFQALPPYVQPNKNSLGYSPFDKPKETTIPCSGNKNKYLCNTMPYFSNPCLKPSQFIQPYYDPQLPETSLQSTSKIPTFDSPYLDQTNPCLNTDYPRETKPMPLFPFAPNTPFSPLNSLSPGSPNLWNNIPYQTIPYLPYAGLPTQNMWSYPPSPYNYLATPMELQQSKFLKSSPTTKSFLEDSSPAKNILQMPPSTYAPSPQVYTRPLHMNPSFSLERDLQILSRKYGIPLSKILDSLEAEMFDSGKICPSTFDLPRSILKYDSSLKSKSTSSVPNAGVHIDNRSGDEDILLESDVTTLTPLDSSLMGPHLDIENAPILVSNTEPLNVHLSLKNQPKQIFQDSSLIGPHLSSLSTGNYLQFSDEDQTGNVKLHLESDSSNLMPLDSSLLGPHLEMRPSGELDSNISQDKIVTSHIEIPGTSSSQVKTKLNIQNQPVPVTLDSSLTGPHLATLAKAKPLFSDEIQNVNNMISIESEFSELTPLDAPQVDPVNEQLGILQNGKTAVTLSADIDNTHLIKSVGTIPNLIKEDILLDSSLISPYLQTDSSSIDSDSVEQKTVSEISQDSLQKANELQSIILPSSMLPTLLEKAVAADSNSNVHTQDAELNEEHNKLSLGTIVNLPNSVTSLITPSLKETDVKILEPTLFQQVVDSDIHLDRSFIEDPIPIHNIETKEKYSSLDSSIQLDSSLIGPSILHEIDSEVMPELLDSVDHLESPIGVTFKNQNKIPVTASAPFGSEIEFDSSLTGPSLFKEINSLESSTSSNFDTHLDNSLIGPSLDEALGTSVSSSVSETKSHLYNSVEGQDSIQEAETLEVTNDFDLENVLDTSLVGPHLSTASFSTDEINIINKELQLQSDLVYGEPLDSSLIGSNLDIESQLDDESEISRYQLPELPELIEQNSVPTVHPSELQELLSKFTNAITKSHLSPSELKPCNKLLSSISKILSDSKNIPCKDLQSYIPILSLDELASGFSARPQTVSFTENLSPVESVDEGQPCFNSNYFSSPVTFPQYTFTKEAPQISIKPYSPFVQIEPQIQHNWQRPPLNIQNIIPCIRPVAENAPVPFISNAEPLSLEDYKLLLDLAIQSNIYPPISNPNIFTPGTAISPSLQSNIPSNILPAYKYAPFLPKESSPVLPSNLQSTTCDTEYNPVEVDDIMSLIKDNNHQILKDMPFSQSFVPPVNLDFEKGDILSSSLLDYGKRPMLTNPLTNAPEEPLFSEMIEPASKFISLPTQSPNVFLESHLRDITNTPQFKESNASPILEKEYLQQLLSKPCLDYPIVLPSSALEALLELPSASNKLNNAPCKSSPVYLPSISPFYSTPISNTFTSPFFPNIANPLSASSAKSISTPRTISPLDLPFASSQITSPKLSINPYTTSPCIPEFSNALTPVKTESGFTYSPKGTPNKPIPSNVPYKPCHTYPSSYLPVQPSSKPSDTSPYSPFINKLTAEISNPYSPVCSQPITAPYFRPAPKSLTNLGLPVYSDSVTPVSVSPIIPTQTGILYPPYFAPEPSFSYTSLPHTSKQKRPSNVLSPAYLTPKSDDSQICPKNFKYLLSNSMSNPISQITYPDLQSLRPISTLPGFYGNNPFSNTNKMPISSAHIPILQYTPCEDVIQSNLQTSPLVEEEPLYNVIEENMYTHGNNQEKYNQVPTFNYPLESMSLTLAPEETAESLSGEDLTLPEDITSAFITSPASAPFLQENIYQKPFLTPCTSLYGKPCPLQHILPQLPLTALNQENICDNISLMPLSNPLKHTVLQPISILSKPLLKPLTPVTPAPKQSVLPSPFLETSLNPYNLLPLKKEPLLSSPYYSTSSQNKAKPTIGPIVVKDMSSPAFFQAPTYVPCTSITSPKSQSSSPVIPNNLIFSSPLNKPKSSSIPNSPIMSHFLPIEKSISSQYSTPLIPTQNFKKLKPVSAPQYMSSISPAPTTYHDSIPLYETPIHYQPVKTPPTGLPSSVKDIFLNPASTSPYTVLPSFNNVAKPLSTDLYKPTWPSFTTQYSLPTSSSLSAPVPSATVPISTCLPVTTPKAVKQALTNPIIPSSLFTIPDKNVVTTTSLKSLSPVSNIPRYSSPCPSFVKPLEVMPYETLSSPFRNSPLPKNILNPNRQLSNSALNAPHFSSPYVTQLLQLVDSYPAQPTTEPYINKQHPVLSPALTPYETPSLASSFIPLPLKTVSNRLINKPQYNPPIVPIYDSPIYSYSSSSNPFLKLKLKPISESPSYPIPNNLISSPKVTPFDSHLLSKVRPPVCQEHLEPYSQITPSPPLFSSSLLKPLAKPVPLKPQLYQPELNPINSQYVSPIESNPQLLPSSSPILNSPLRKPLLTNPQYITPIFPMHLPRLNTATSESPLTKLPSVTNSYQYLSPSTSLLSEIPQTAERNNLLTTTPYTLFKSQFNQLKPRTMTNMPLYSNYGVVEPSPDLSIKANIISIAKPCEVSDLDSSLLSLEPLNPEIAEEIKPAPDSQYRLLPLPTRLSQQRPFSPASTSKYLVPKSSSKYTTSQPRPPFSVPSEEIELIDTTDFIPLSQIKSEPLIAEYSPTESQATILKSTPSTPDISQFFPFSTLLNPDSTSPTYKTLPQKLQTANSINQYPHVPPLFLSPQEYKELIQGPSIPIGSLLCSPSNFLTPKFEPQLVSSPLAGRPPPMSSESGSWLQSAPTLGNYLTPLETPKGPLETQSIESFLNNYRLFNKITPLQVNSYPKRLVTSIPEVLLPQNILKPIGLTKSGPNTDYGEKHSSDFNEFDSEIMPLEYEIENNTVDENRVGSSSIETLPEIIKDLNIPIYNEKSQRPQRLSQLDHFYANNHIGKSPQVYNVPTYKNVPINVKSPFTAIAPDIFNFNTIANKNVDPNTKLDNTSQMRPNEYLEYENSLKNVPITNAHSQTYLNPYLEPYPKINFSPNQIKIDKITEIPYQPLPYVPNFNIDDIKYSGYKTYQLPALKYPKSTQYLGTPTQINDNVYKPSEFQPNPSNFHFYTPTEVNELYNTQSLNLVDMATPLETKLGLDTSQASPELNDYDLTQYQTLEDVQVEESPKHDEYNPLEDETVSVDNINDDNELKTSLINYINRNGFKNNLDKNDGEITIPIGNLAITKKEPNNADTIETNNPSIGLKVWKSNVKIAQAELKLKVKDISVNNFMPVVNNIDKYDMEEIRKIVKNYIDEKYGSHIEVNEPYSIDNKYSVIKDFDPVKNKYNILWPTQYV